jgi:hypothetical protein
MKHIFLWSGVGLLVAAALVFFVTFSNPGERTPPPDVAGEDFSREMPQEGATHVAEGAEVSYQSNPPTSGSHWSDPLRDGVYQSEKPDEALVHSLEHGRIWISYRPNIGEETIQALEDLARSEHRIILTPREANDSDIALAAWARLDTFNLSEDGTFDAQRVLDFIARYRDQGPEYVPQMTGKTYE